MIIIADKVQDAMNYYTVYLVLKERFIKLGVIFNGVNTYK